MSEVVYTSKVKVDRKGKDRLAYLPAEDEPVPFGIHSEIAEHYKRDIKKEDEHAATLDYIVAAAAGWLVGTFAGALEARKIDLSGKSIIAEADGEVESDNGVLIIKRIHVVYRLSVSDGDKETVERVHDMHAEYCPVYRSIYKAIDVTTEYKIENW